MAALGAVTHPPAPVSGMHRVRPSPFLPRRRAQSEPYPQPDAPLTPPGCKEGLVSLSVATWAREAKFARESEHALA